MKENATKTLKNIYKINSDCVEANRKAKFDLQGLLSDFYPDQGHFIFELLQNAEDANATTIRFNLTKDELIVKHNGKRLFNSEDVESITSIAHSMKRDDLSKIGKFGIGFKSAFSYSKTPRIYSGDYNFEIQDLVCPHEISGIQKSDRETVFSFPFNNPSKTKDSCFNEIKNVFESLDHTILLFLDNIEIIKWAIEERHKGSVVREHIADMNDELIRISITNSSNETFQEDAWFLRFQRALEGYGDLKCSIALNLAFRNNSQTNLDPRKKLYQQMKVIPTEGRLCVFFPAVKETTKLKIHVNGPYEASVDRASIKHNHENNRKIFDATSHLFVDSMERIKEIGLLTSEFLEILPNKDDSLLPFYDVMREFVYDALRNKEFIPCLDGGCGKAEELMRGRKDIIDVLGDNGLAILLNDSDKKRWTTGVMRNSRSDNLLISLDIPYWGYKELIDAVDNRYRWYLSSSNSNAFIWLQKQNDNWFQLFYLLLSTAIDQDKRSIYINTWKIIRDQNGKIFTGNKCYFPIKENTFAFEISTVSDKIFDKLKKERRDRLMRFLKDAGVKQFGEHEELQQILSRFYGKNPELPRKDIHLEHIKRFIKWSENGNESAIFQDCSIFLDHNEKYRSGSEFYIDIPFEETGLCAIYSNSEKRDMSRYPLWPNYANIEKFIPFAKICGAIVDIEISESDVSKNPKRDDLYEGTYGSNFTDKGINKDYYIESLEELLEKKDIDISKLIWRSLSKAMPCVLHATYKPNQRFQPRVQPSSLIQTLMNFKWIPGKDGEFYSPHEMSKGFLRDNFEYDDNNGWLTAIGFSNRQSSKIEAIMKEIGISGDIENLPESQEDIMEKIENLVTPVEFPERPSKNPRKRANQARVRAGDAPEKKYEYRERRVRTSQSVEDKRTYLEQSYINTKNQLICQMCEKEMPFRLKDGRYYFESVEMFKKTEISKEHERARIALCPLCAAKFIELIRKDEEQRQRLWNDLVKLDIGAAKGLRVELDFGEKKGSIRFVETHLIDVRQILKVEGKGRKDPSS